VGPRVGLDGYGNSASTGIRFPDLPARRDSVHRLSYRGPHNVLIAVLFVYAVYLTTVLRCVVELLYGHEKRITEAWKGVAPVKSKLLSPHLPGVVIITENPN
jgi:hypothetical protein